MSLRRTVKRAAVGAAVAAAWVIGGSAAYAHIQVTPTVVAPGDAVKFTITVPGESAARTTKVELQLPPNLLPFAWEDPPGWRRQIVPGDDPLSLGNVIWTGRMAPDAFVEFSFLAGTPEEAGELSWRALQTYSDGTVVRWVGPPGSEEPAAVTVVDPEAPRQNAGGESAPAEPTEPTETEPTETEPTETTETTETTPAETTTEAEEHEEEGEAAAPTSSEDGVDWVARFFALIAIACAFAAIAFVLLRKPGAGGGESSGGSGGET